MPVGAITVGVRDGEITAIFESPGEGISFDEYSMRIWRRGSRLRLATRPVRGARVLQSFVRWVI